MIRPQGATNSRDKNLLILLGVVVILFILYYFVLSPALDKIGQINMERATVLAELQTAQTTVEQLPANRKKAAEDLAVLTEKYKQFFYEINQERLLNKLDTLIVNAKLTVDSYNQTKPAAQNISEQDMLYAPITYPLMEQAAVINEKLAESRKFAEDRRVKEKEPGAPENQVAVAYITLRFIDATYQNFFNFLRSIETFDRGIIIENFNIGNGGEGTALNGQVVLGIYSLAKPDENESVDLEFTPVLPKGKANPFQ